MFASNGILFNHESPLRVKLLLPEKLLLRIKDFLRVKDKLFLGNLNARRDWGHAKDYVEGMWKILQHNTAEDFVLQLIQIIVLESL